MTTPPSGATSLHVARRINCDHEVEIIEYNERVVVDLNKRLPLQITRLARRCRTTLRINTSSGDNGVFDAFFLSLLKSENHPETFMVRQAVLQEAD